MAIGTDGNWVNSERPLDDSNYMSIAEWCAWMTRVAAELLDKGASEQLDLMRIAVPSHLKRDTTVADGFQQAAGSGWENH